MMKQCPKGHFYDETKHTQCPYCSVANLDLSVTRPIRNPQPQPAPTPTPQPRPVESAEKTAARPEKTVAKSSSAANEGKTVGILSQTIGFDPVVGWLVCVDGPGKGKDYRLRSEKNFIGRSNRMDVAITDDNGISRDNHAIVSYNPKNNSFKILQGDGHGLTYLNDDEVLTPMELKRGDIVEIGKTKLMFVPFCGESFKW